MASNDNNDNTAMALTPTPQPQEVTPDKYDLIRKTVAAGTSENEFRLFIEVCKLTGLNPFTRQIYAIMRRQNEGGQWANKMTIQTGIDGYRLLAARTGQLAGIDDPIYDTETGEHPNRATITVYRWSHGQRVPFSATARWREYVAINKDGNPVAMWAKMPWLMLGKVAEALALRRAFPAEISGVYTAEEMDQADVSADGSPYPYVEQTAPAAAPSPASPSAEEPDRIGAALKQKPIFDLLVQLQRFSDKDRRAELTSVFTAIEARGEVVNGKAVKAELQARLDELNAMASDEGNDDGGADARAVERSLEGLPEGAGVH